MHYGRAEGVAPYSGRDFTAAIAVLFDALVMIATGEVLTSPDWNG